MSIAAAGVVEIHPDDIIDDANELSKITNPSDDFQEGVNESENHLEDNLVMKTKKQFKEEYLRRKEKRDRIMNIIESRERKIEHVQNALNLSLSELFLVVVYDKEHQKWRVLPILGISFPKTEIRNRFSVKLLIDWKIGSKINPNGNQPVKSPPKPSRPDEFPLPDITPLQCEWTSIDILMKGNAYIISMNTQVRTPKLVTFSKHWSIPETKNIPTGNDKKAKDTKDKKGKDSKAIDPNVVTIDSVVEDTGLSPITFIKLDISSFAEDETTNNLNTAGSSSDLLNFSEKITSEEVEDAIREQVNEVNKVDNIDNNSRPTTAGKVTTAIEDSFHNISEKSDRYLSLSVLIHADLTTSAHQYDRPESSNSDHYQKNILPSDVTLILQEVRMDNVEPMMFVMELKQYSYLPITHRTFIIPHSKLSLNNNSHSLVFWVRLFTKSSVFLSFSSAVDISIGEAEKIWAEMGKSSFVREGDTGITQTNTEQLLFRCPAQSAENVDDSIIPFICVSHRHLFDLVNLKVIKEDSTQLPTLVASQGDKQNITFTSPLILVGTIDPIITKNITPLPPFHWKLLVLSDKPIVEPVKPINEKNVTQRYDGKYIPNNKLALFRDVYSIDKASFPFGLRITTQPNASNTSDNTLDSNNVFNKIQITLNLYKKSDGTLISKYNGKGFIHCYFESLNKFLSEGEENKKVDTKDAKAAKGKGVVVDSQDIIVECVLNSNLMKLPEEWTSRFPHVFDAMFSSTSEEQNPLNIAKPSANSIFNWQVDILSGKVINVSHDITNLLRYTAIKNSCM